MAQKIKDSMVVLSELEKVLLTLLFDRNLYGLEFVNAIKTASKGRRKLGVGSLYPTLTRMEKKGFVRWYWGDEQSGPRRKYYEMTPYGQSVLEEDWQFHEQLRSLDVPSASVEEPAAAHEDDTLSSTSALSPHTSK